VPAEFQLTRGAAGPTKVVTEVCAFSVGPLRHVRAALIAPEDPTTSGARVLNFVAFPHPWANLPVFGADLVTLPGGHLVLVDLHPMASPAAHATQVLPALLPIHTKYQGSSSIEEFQGQGRGEVSTLLPWGGPLPEEAKHFFSPAALWTRLPNDASGNAQLQDLVCRGAMLEYLEVFLDLCAEATPAGTTAGVLSFSGDDADPQDGSENDEAAAAASTLAAAVAHQRAYSAYRIAKDPARGMLTRMHGAEWADKLIAEVLFDFDLRHPVPKPKVAPKAAPTCAGPNGSSPGGSSGGSNPSTPGGLPCGPATDDASFGTAFAARGGGGGSNPAAARSDGAAPRVGLPSVAELQRALVAAEAKATTAAAARTVAEAAAAQAKAAAAAAVATAEAKAVVAEVAIEKLAAARASQVATIAAQSQDAANKAAEL
jgi:phycoerythrobilin:ferredoxin oxidoreductase